MDVWEASKIEAGDYFQTEVIQFISFAKELTDAISFALSCVNKERFGTLGRE